MDTIHGDLFKKDGGGFGRVFNGDTTDYIPCVRAPTGVARPGTGQVNKFTALRL